MRDRKYVMVLYPEDQTHADAMERIRNGGFDYAACLHDKDVHEDGDNKGELKKPHWHIVIRFVNAVFRDALAKKLGLEPNYIQECRNLDAALKYLVHFDYPDKYQYDLDSVEGQLKTRVVTLTADKDENSRVLCLLSLLDSLGRVKRGEFIRLSCKNGLYSDARRMGALLSAIIEEHNQEIDIQLGVRAECQRDRDKFEEYERFTGSKGINDLPPL